MYKALMSSSRLINIISASFFLTILAVPAQTQSSLVPAFTEYTRAQVIDWIDDETYAVGRWDGSLAIFRVPKSGELTPVLLQTRVVADEGGVEMIATLDSRTIVFSDGLSAVGMWTRETATLFDRYYRFTYDSALGVANSATIVPGMNSDLLLTGHDSGFVQVWERHNESLAPIKTIDLRSPDPIPSPYPLKNIRGLVAWQNGIVLAASEDGDIVGFRPADGTILFRQRYNVSAERGVNNIALMGNKLLLANCSVGPNDKNLWLYEVSETGIKLLDSINLVKDSKLPQSFDFDADLFDRSGVLHFFASTQEGLLWAGHLEADKFVIDGTGKVDAEGAAILDINRSGTFLAAAAQQIMLFKQ